MICEKCNKTIDDDSKFCLHCGEKIEIKQETENLKEAISSNLEIEPNEDKQEIKINSMFKKVAFRIIAVVLSYFGFVAVKVWLVTKGISFGEVTLLSLFVFLAIYKLVVGYSLNIKSSKNMGIWFVIISIFLVFISVRYELKANDTFIADELSYLKNTTPKKLDENTTLLSVNIDGMNVEFKYYIDNVNIDNMTKEVKNNFEKTVKTELCKEQLFIEVMNHNYNLNMKYLDKSYQIIGEVDLSKNQCK